MDTAKMRDEVKGVLSREDVKYVIGYEKGTYGFRVSPAFIDKVEDVDKLIISPLCVNNLALYLTNKDKPPVPRGQTAETETVGLVVKGCDSRAVVQILIEGGYPRENLIIIGIPCTGVVDIKKLNEKFPDCLEGDVEEKDDKFIVTVDGQKHDVPKDELLLKKCKTCKYPNPVEYDILIGDKVQERSEDYSDVTSFEEMSGEERWAFFESEFSKCIRCSACRNVCPLCYCQVCVLESLKPQWIRRSPTLSDNTVYHITRAFSFGRKMCGL